MAPVLFRKLLLIFFKYCDFLNKNYNKELKAGQKKVWEQSEQNSEVGVLGDSTQSVVPCKIF